MSSTDRSKFDQMTKDPVRPLIAKLAVPTIISMLVSSLYNMADTYFVGGINKSATAGVSVALPITATIQAIGFFCGIGSANYISRALGAKDRKSAEKMASTGFFLSVGIGILITIIGSIFITPITNALGATETSYGYAVSYIRILLLGAPFMMGSYVLNNQLRFQGNKLML